MESLLLVFALVFAIAVLVFAVWALMHWYPRDSGNPQQRITDLQEQKYSTDMNRFAARKETKASQARTDLGIQLGLESKANSDMLAFQREATTQKFDLDNAESRLKDKRELEELKHTNESTTLKIATEHGRSHTGHLEYERQALLSEVKVTEHKKLAEIDLEKRWKEIVQDLDSADLLEISEQQLLNKLRDNLIALERERYQISKGEDPAPVKKRILARYNKDIQYLGELIDARQTGRFLSQNREEVRRLAEGTSESGADS